jgi:hypothetical protein
VKLTPNAANPSTGRNYILKQFTPSTGPAVKPRVVGCRPSLLRRGGGRNDTNGWTQQKLTTCRLNLAALGGIHACLSLTMEADRCPSEYKAANEILRQVCRRSALPCVCVWEGPNPHCHIAFGSPVPESVVKQLKRRMEKFWVSTWGSLMGDKAFCFRSEVKPKETEAYLGKTRKGATPVKEALDWLCFCPWWKSKVSKSKRELQRGKFKQKASHSFGIVLADSPSVTPPSKEAVSIDSPYALTIAVSGNREGLPLLDGKSVCGVCWGSWGRALKVGCCVCSGHVKL